MSPRELLWRLEAERERDVQQFEQLAQLACWVLNPWLKRGQKLTVAKLLKRRRSS